jgi:GTP cyclohydrolase I
MTQDPMLNPRGAGTVLETKQACVTLGGVGPRGTTTMTSALLGTLSPDARSRPEFFTPAGAEPANCNARRPKGEQ